MKRDLYATVSARIIAELERGAAPWVKPWSATAGHNVPCNAVTNRPYSGTNVILLWMSQAAGYCTPRYLTFKQALEVGGAIRKGEHGTKVYFVKQLQVADRDGEEGETRIVPMMREYTVFNVDQTEGLSATIKESYAYDLAATAQSVVKLAQPMERYETGFNAEYLLEALKTFGRNRSAAIVSICSHDLGSPHVIACDIHETYVLMPMRV